MGYLLLDDVIETYNLTMGQPGCVSPQRVKTQAQERNLLHYDCIAIGGQRYTSVCRYVWPACKTPLTGTGGNGKQLQWLKRHQGVMP